MKLNMTIHLNQVACCRIAAHGFRPVLLASLALMALSPAWANPSADALIWGTVGNMVRGAQGALTGQDQPATPDKTSPSTPPKGDSTAAAPRPGCLRTRAKPLDPVGSRPPSYAPATLWPEDTGCDYYSFSDLKFDAARTQKANFEEASKVPCSSCQGGYSYDAWAQPFAAKGGDYFQKLQEILLALKIGQNISWKGKRYGGTIEATGDHPIGSCPCRQFHWKLKQGEGVVAERYSLYCQYKAEYTSKVYWHEVL